MKENIMNTELPHWITSDTPQNCQSCGKKLDFSECNNYEEFEELHLIDEEFFLCMSCQEVYFLGGVCYGQLY